jgi:hypothetical protein
VRRHHLWPAISLFLSESYGLLRCPATSSTHLETSRSLWPAKCASSRFGDLAQSRCLNTRIGASERETAAYLPPSTFRWLPDRRGFLSTFYDRRHWITGCFDSSKNKAFRCGRITPGRQQKVNWLTRGVSGAVPPHTYLLRAIARYRKRALR